MLPAKVLRRIRIPYTGLHQELTTGRVESIHVPFGRLNGRIRILLGSDRSGFSVFQARRGCEFIVAGTLRVPSAKLGNTNSLGV